MTPDVVCAPLEASRARPTDRELARGSGVLRLVVIASALPTPVIVFAAVVTLAWWVYDMTPMSRCEVSAGKSRATNEAGLSQR